MLIGFESGTIVLWDLRGKCAEMRWQSIEPLRSLGWHHEGKHFVSSHTDGSLCTWPLRPTPKPQFHSYPHGMCYDDTNKKKNLNLKIRILSIALFNAFILPPAITLTVDSKCHTAIYYFLQLY